MKKCKVLFAFIAILTLLLAFSTVASAATGHVNDKAKLLTAAEKSDVADMMTTLSRKTGADCYFLTSYTDVGELDLYDLCRENGISSGADYVILAVSSTFETGYRYTAYTSGTVSRYLSGNASHGELSRILDDLSVYVPLKQGQFGEGVSAFCSLCEEAYGTGGDSGLRIRFAVGISFGLIAAIIPSVIIATRYRKKLKAPVYPLSKYANLELTKRSDVLLRRRVREFRRSSSSHGGSGNRGIR